MRYTVEKCHGEPRKYGYTIRDHKPHVQIAEDIEGIGLCFVTPRIHHFCGWYRRKSNAQARANILNKN